VSKNVFGKILKQYRMQRELTLCQLGNQADMHFAHLNKIENGLLSCGALRAEKLARALNLKGTQRDTFLKSASSTVKRKMKSDIQWIGPLIEKAATNAVQQYLSENQITKSTHQHDIVITVADGRTYKINIKVQECTGHKRKLLFNR
jgi:transcriptional regulator with XRE-family HTH domain